MAKQSKPRLLLIEDEAALRNTLKINLKEQNYKVMTAADGYEGLEKALDKTPDLVLLDLMLPGMDGLSLLRALREKSDVPVLILTAKGSELDKIMGLESGADDYLTKPFSLGELFARVRALLRRANQTRMRDKIVSGHISLDLVSRRAVVGGRDIDFSPKEFSLLAELIRNQGAVLSRDFLLNHVWGVDYIGDPRTVDVHIRWLREKIEENPSQPTLIQTVRGIGYRYEAMPDEDKNHD